MSLNLLTEHETDPVVWRGPVIAGTVTQFWTDVIWGDLDYLFVDMPPGTGDVPLTVFQSLPVDGVIVVTSPQDLVIHDRHQGGEDGPDDGHPRAGPGGELQLLPAAPTAASEHAIFGESHIEALAGPTGISRCWPSCPSTRRWPRAMDEGRIESYEPNPLAGVAQELDEKLGEA